MDSTLLYGQAKDPEVSVNPPSMAIRQDAARRWHGQTLACGGDDGRAQLARCRRLLLTLLFTDIVGSTQLVERLGDRAWHGLLHQQRAIVRTQVARLGGVEVDCCGDGFFGIFPMPALALQCAAFVCEALLGFGIEMRAGVHVGECEFEDEGHVSGIAVHIAARIASLARPREVLVSETVKDLVAGSGLEFADRGRRTLKGLARPRRLFALDSSTLRLRHDDPDLINLHDEAARLAR